MILKHVTLFVLYVVSISVNNCAMSTLRNLPGYGKSWLYMSDDDGVPINASLVYDNNFQQKSSRDADDGIFFILYTRENPNGERLSRNANALKNSTFNFNRPTKFVTHGWMSNGNKSMCQTTKNVYLDKYDVNVIVVDWGETAENIMYPVVAASTHDVGVHYAKFLDFLICQGAHPKTFHLVGHSLGAHVSGIAGHRLYEDKIGRMTGLDPASPLFNLGLFEMLTPASAEFVDVIHTTSGTIGIQDPMGHVDFYPNGGDIPQPGCFGLEQIIQGCSHSRSWQYFTESIEFDDKFLSYKCTSEGDFELGKCVEETTLMGEHVNTNSTGRYYLTINM